ncbi:putative plus-end-directed kinesin ATPase transcription factor bZIP family [Helianthus annuus]|uniref:Plus-end-directed kinesin ATPase transcription factor bZIP family n=1 Tax=Helianthus annuus TaxID=4232 RepID=A0A251T962_HELAN|nr:kinesin-like protein KIN-7E, chloroplastic [Helianthus annuus]KAF5780429.1 putative plus-end-directed kinesin ATPase transcription factor bZIP family [Helianthus annuus]KAJ0869093.1 putative plus-end-directed kinesin ATPase transcription factor bZIP family [Helianthus annuus]
MSFTTTRSSSRSSTSPFRSRKSSDPPPDTTRRTTKPPATKPSQPPPLSSSSSSHKVKENVTVTVRLRPLNSREIGKGDEVAWFADGDYSIQNEFNPAFAYGFDRVFGPATTTRQVYDVAAHHVVNGAMEGVNGTVFAYGVTSSGKTHTMHGEQKSPGIIPLAVKDVFGIIQETPGREFLLRVSYLEIYNEVINDLLNPTGQNLRIREDSQGTYVEGIKEEVVLSPAHALSLIASGEAHRHVGSNNFNLLSSRSHTIFTLMIESSPCGENMEEEVTLSQLHLIDLAGSESSKTETTGMRRKEGSYINKSLLTLGTVISKLTDSKSAHIPYRDSKLTRLLQSSLSGHGRVSLICTVTPASSNTEETHNTLKFAHRSKHVEIKASQNKIIDEKSLIKKYQKEISSLKQELQQLKRGMKENSYMMAPNQEDLVNMKLQLEAGQVKLQSRLEEEEQAKAALMGRIQRLTKLILVSTKNTMASNIPENPDHRRRHSFGEDELVYLPEKKRGIFIDDDAGSIDSEVLENGKSDVANLDELVKDFRKNRRKGMLGWFKLKKPDHVSGLSPHTDHESSTSDSPTSSRSSKSKAVFSDTRDGVRSSVGRKADDVAVGDLLLQRTQAGDLFSAAASGRRLPPTGTTITDQMDLIHEQVKMLSGDLALCTSSLKRLSEQAVNRPEDLQLQEQMQKLKNEIKGKKSQIRLLEQRMISSVEMNPHNLKGLETSQVPSKLVTQLNEKTFELEIKTADNRILQDQLQVKVSENAEMQQTILLLRQQLESFMADNESSPRRKKYINEEKYANESTPTSVMSLNKVFSQEDSIHGSGDTFLNSQLLMQATEIETLKKEKAQIAEEKDGLMICSQKLADEGSYAKELAAAAAVELRNLAAEVTKLSYQNAKLNAELAVTKEAYENLCKKNNDIGSRQDACVKKPEDGLLVEELRKELNARHQREASLVGALSERDKLESELRKRLDAAKRHEEDLEAELANMWALVAKLKNPASSENILADQSSTVRCNVIFQEDAETQSLNDIRRMYDKEKEMCRELERYVSRLKGDDIADLDINSLEELQNLNVEAITKICHAKASYR